MPLQLTRAPWWPLIVLLLVTVIGGYFFNTVHARGTVVSDATGQPIGSSGGGFVVYGVRKYTLGDDGAFDLPDLPRGARLSALVPGYTRKEFDASDTEVRLTVGVVNFNVTDVDTAAFIPKPEARTTDGKTSLGVGTETGSIAVPQPPSDILICTKDYAAQTVRIVQPVIEVKLKRTPGADCPPLAAPTPTPRPTASPSVSPTATPAPSGTP